MKWHNKFSIRIRLLFLVLIFLFFFSFLIFLAIKEIYDYKDTAEKQFLLIDNTRAAQVEFKKQVQEWKNILIRGYNKKDYEKYKNKFLKSHQKTQKILMKVKLKIKDNQELSFKINALLAKHSSLLEKYLIALKFFNPEKPLNPRTIDKMVRGIDRAPTDIFDEIVLVIQKYFSKENLASRRKIITQFIGMFLFSVTILSLFAYWIIRGVTRPIDRALNVVNKIANKDFTTPIQNYTGHNEVSKLLNSMKTMEDNIVDTFSILQNNFTETRLLTDKLNISSENFQSMADNLSNYSKFSEDRSNEVRREMEKISTSMQDFDNYTLDTTKIINSIMNSSADSKSMVNELKQVSEKFKENTLVGKESLSKLKDNTTKIDSAFLSISKIIENISRFSKETSMLALNASIEAERAGESGEGFIVVAEQVTKLSGEIHSNIRMIHNFSNEVKSSIEVSLSSINGILNLLERIFNTGETIFSYVDNVSEKSNQNNKNLESLLSRLDELQTILQKVKTEIEKGKKNTVDIEKQSQNVSEEARKIYKGSLQIDALSKDINNGILILKKTFSEFKLKA